jgi:diaminopimelate epimerase
VSFRTLLPFTKVEAIGNNFVLINGLSLGDTDCSDLAIRMCVHHFGVGADGLLVLLPSLQADLRMTMFNPDGTEDVCGNGLRCVAAHAYLTGLAGKKDILIEAKDGLHQASIVRARKDSADVRVNMGRPSTRASDMPALVEVDELIDYPLDLGDKSLGITCVNIGTPHAVICASLESFWENIPDSSAAIEIHPVFPERISVTWCYCESPESLRIRTWERAVGPTLGCGTGACAALVAANLHGLAGPRAHVTSPGGALEIEWPDRHDVYMTGPANTVYQGEWYLE